mgnify:CR=1 FL=1|tara:strand:+ start:245 stop:841 length:597 start_codon:yes stop_codon:yes gene_type:complete
MTKVVGITGGIGSGKTTLSKYLKQTGFFVHESDKVVSDIYKNPKKNFLNFIIKNISKNAVNNNKIRKKIVTNIIFSHKERRIKLERYIHKEVQLSRKKFIQTHTKEKKKIIFVDIPLLFENNLDNKFDLIICIISSKTNRTQRVLKNKKFSKKTLNYIFEAQTSDKQRRKRSQIIITNNKTKKDFIFNAEKALIKILK